MVRILPGRLKPSSASNSRSSSPMRNKMDLGPVKDTGLALKVAILKVRTGNALALARLAGPSRDWTDLD